MRNIVIRAYQVILVVALAVGYFSGSLAATDHFVNSKVQPSLSHDLHLQTSFQTPVSRLIYLFSNLSHKDHVDGLLSSTQYPHYVK